jgi:hypothetical protein
LRRLPRRRAGDCSMGNQLGRRPVQPRPPTPRNSPTFSPLCRRGAGPLRGAAFAV